jgi:hypothetical protein
MEQYMNEKITDNLIFIDDFETEKNINGYIIYSTIHKDTLDKMNLDQLAETLNETTKQVENLASYVHARIAKILCSETLKLG